MPLRPWRAPPRVRNTYAGFCVENAQLKGGSRWQRNRRRPYTSRALGGETETNIRADLYSILQVPETATKAEIRSAYRALARRLHPDTNSGIDQGHQFQAVNDAYAVLSDDKLRKRYDEIGYAALGLRDVPLGTAARRTRPAEHGKDVMAVMWLDLVEAALGIERPLQVKIAVPCPECKGAGSSAILSQCCRLCRGSGEIIRQQAAARNSRLGYLGLCPMCGGKGVKLQRWCQKCGSCGLAKVKRMLQVRVPPGVDHNSVLRLKGIGDQGRFGGKSGDVYVSFVIKARPDIARQGLDLFSKVNVAYTDAILGSVYKVQTIWGHEDLRIPPGTQHGAVLCLKGKGIDSRRSGQAAQPGQSTGSHLFEVVMRLPVQVDSKEKLVLERLLYLQTRLQTH